MLRVSIANEQTILTINPQQLKSAVRRVLGDAGRTRATVSVALVDDSTIHELNRRYLNHDYATDVLSFVYERDEHHLNGEVVTSVDTAIRVADELAWNPHDELLLYVVHGALHLVGFDDVTDTAAAEMRRREREVLSSLGVACPPGDLRR